MRVAILGGPGSGKGTQAKMLSERYRVPQISTGDLLREALKNNRGLSEEARQAMAEGRLVDDAVVHKLLEERLRKRDTKRGFVIDGYPRNIPQAQALDILLSMLGKILQIAINIDVDDKVLVKRMVNRISCGKCGAIYSKRFSQPKVKDKCDRCGGALLTRADDTTKTARVRIGVYHAETTPLITYYRAQHKLRTMSGGGEIEQIYQKLCNLVDLEIRPLEIKTLEIAADADDEMETTFIAGGQINRIDPEIMASKRPQKKKIIIITTTKTTRKKSSTLAKKKVAKKTKVIKKTAQKKQTAVKTATKTTSKTTVRKPAKEATSKPISKAKKVTKKKLASNKATKETTPAKPVTRTKKIIEKSCQKI